MLETFKFNAGKNKSSLKIPCISMYACTYIHFVPQYVSTYTFVKVSVWGDHGQVSWLVGSTVSITGVLIQ